MCKFTDIEFEIEQQIIIEGTSSRIRRRALRDPQFFLKICYSKDDVMNRVPIKLEIDDSKDAKTNEVVTKPEKVQGHQRTCRNCGRDYPHGGC
jgi:hypothetical protein